ncbi:Non-specific serine/threonine protein kinase [Sulfidibacter corallicola]|uniref:Serine/threonine-protein kinase PknK n=1 Tax=Sulfidibacter corallicola TaxID=2818388 RepID=A0A8A4TI10_SULCO|nr:serine/threonine-protein kinase [Sulfidibacter corallicola]QTD49556.1 serine/threonine-protein kinase PknK [Sulfidibacter corallicola]
MNQTKTPSNSHETSLSGQNGGDANKQNFPYEVIGEFVRGGCSIIYKIKGPKGSDQEGKQFVLKTMDMSDEEPQGPQRFYMEYEFLRAYPHSNLIEVKEFFPDWEGQPAYVMEWVEGDTWQNFWKKRTLFDSLPSFLNLFKQLCDVLDFVHKHQIIHRDLKPQNILISRKEVLKLIDFGIMKVADMTMYTHRNTFMGSAYYVSPEGISGEQVAHTADIFAVGVMLYDLFTGMKPFKGPTLGETIYQRLVKKPQPPSQIADTPEELDPIILKMLSRDPRHRQQSCGEIYRDLERVLRSFSPTQQVTEHPKIDVLTRGPLLHGNFIQNLKDIWLKHRMLYLKGEPSSGKTTIVENLCSEVFGESPVRLECRQGTNILEFMEMILQHIKIPHDKPHLNPWKEILATALPRLQWPSPGQYQELSHSTILTAFLRVFFAVEEVCVIAVERLHECSSNLAQFIVQLAQSITSSANKNIYMVLTTQKHQTEFSAIGPPIAVEVPDVIALSDYLVARFGPCASSVELTTQLLKTAHQNVGRFIEVVDEFRTSGKLAVRDGVLVMQQSPNESILLGTPDPNVSTMPMNLKEFNTRQLEALLWVALCPDGIDLNLLTKLTGANYEEISSTIETADKLNFLDFQSSTTEGFRWKNEKVRHYLTSSLPPDERARKYGLLAETIENETRNYLTHSPPLWFMLSRLYQQAENDTKASQYALNYARYCFQNANYEPIRKYLSLFIPLPQFQNNLEFWSMLALAYKSTDSPQALYFARKALKINRNVHTLSLAAILEFQCGNHGEAHGFIHQVFAQPNFRDLSIHYASLLQPILMAFNEYEKSQVLFTLLYEKLKSRQDPFATNTLVTAKIRLLQPYPAKLVHAVGKVQGDLLPQTQRRLHQWCSLAHQELFEYDLALDNLHARELEADGDLHYYRNLMFLYLNFRKFVEVKKLVSNFSHTCEKYPRLKQLEPLFQLSTEIVVRDPNTFDFTHLCISLQDAKLDLSSWLALIISTLDFNLVSGELVEQVLSQLEAAAIPWAQHQIPRFRVMAAIKTKRYNALERLWEKALQRLQDFNLVMERVRLVALYQYMQNNHIPLPKQTIMLPHAIMERPETAHFLRGE